MKKRKDFTPEELESINAILAEAIAEAWPELIDADENGETVDTYETRGA